MERYRKLRKQGLGWRTIETKMRKLGYDITFAGIRKELLKMGLEKGVNLPSKKSTEKKQQ